MQSMILAIVFATASSASQPSFSTWCNDIAGFSQSRCAAERAGDKASYERYLARRDEFQAEVDRKDARPQFTWGKSDRLPDVTPDYVRGLSTW